MEVTRPPIYEFNICLGNLKLSSQPLPKENQFVIPSKDVFLHSLHNTSVYQTVYEREINAKLMFCNLGEFSRWVAKR